ncbi:MAG: hypothetical protein ABR529_02590 [Actinomycetota bacterium]
MANEVSIVFEPTEEEGVFRALRIEEEVEGHLRRTRDDLSRVAIEPVRHGNEAHYRIMVGTDDDVAGHAATGLLVYLMRRPDDKRGRVDASGDDDVAGHISRPQDKPELL